MSKLSRNDPCHCGSGKKYKKCHLEADEVDARDERAAAAAAIPRVEMESKPLGPKYWALVGLGVVISIGVAVSRDVGSGLVVAAAWALGMIAWAVIRDPPPPRPDAGDPAALNFGVTGDQGDQKKRR